MREVPLTVLRGFLMGAADVVPGVSGGAVALVLAIYRRLIEAIRTARRRLGTPWRTTSAMRNGHPAPAHGDRRVPLRGALPRPAGDRRAGPTLDSHSDVWMWRRGRGASRADAPGRRAVLRP